MAWSEGSIRYNLSVNEAFIMKPGERSTWQISPQFIGKAPPTSSFRRQPTAARQSSSMLDREDMTVISGAAAEVCYDESMSPSSTDSLETWLGPAISMEGDRDRHTTLIDIGQPSSMCFQCLLGGNKQCDKKRPSCAQCSDLNLVCEEQAPFLVAGKMYLTALPEI
ncbi:hypothetical protein CGGC5_v017084 [Colletotrichum fructicola Nara gc5]|uniref:Zn(2)-C6 fungal-type domain-containing protein n=1 Tax=Colletotrichum fructicola (strain Nara gc5) TaxID=1213859 RepID=A0A7J6IF16_COLFN|nr:hypothetical protein CGGC5_v017084 [Colletotrichum fructicola Nara gc5]